MMQVLTTITTWTFCVVFVSLILLTIKDTANGLFVISSPSSNRIITRPPNTNNNFVLALTKSSSEDDDSDNGDADDKQIYQREQHNFQSLSSRRRHRRRDFLLGWSLVSSGLLLSLTQNTQNAWGREDVEQGEDSSPSSSSSCNIDCLSDLPPLDKDKYVRIYLCRHGQTENNRLGRIQGVRADPPLNDTGKKQAKYLGRALFDNACASTTQQQQQPTMVLHSPLQRAKETAAIAVAEYTTTSTLDSSSKKTKKKITPPLLLQEIPSLKEIDFGEYAEGQPVQLVRADMVATYAKWSVGEIDIKMVDGTSGESAREIYDRIQVTLNVLIDAAMESPNKCIAAIAHSTYIRIILAALMDASLIQVSTIQQNNANINVIDLNFNNRNYNDHVLTKNTSSKLLGGGRTATTSPRTSSSEDYKLTVPDAKIVRINEKRHLACIN